MAQPVTVDTFGMVWWRNRLAARVLDAMMDDKPLAVLCREWDKKFRYAVPRYVEKAADPNRPLKQRYLLKLGEGDEKVTLAELEAQGMVLFKRAAAQMVERVHNELCHLLRTGHVCMAQADEVHRHRELFEGVWDEE